MPQKHRTQEKILEENILQKIQTSSKEDGEVIRKFYEEHKRLNDEDMKFFIKTLIQTIK